MDQRKWVTVLNRDFIQSSVVDAQSILIPFRNEQYGVPYRRLRLSDESLTQVVVDVLAEDFSFLC
jgi:hypothetical protein